MGIAWYSSWKRGADQNWLPRFLPIEAHEIDITVFGLQALSCVSLLLNAKLRMKSVMMI
jgi:hypothetical protein